MLGTSGNPSLRTLKKHFEKKFLPTNERSVSIMDVDRFVARCVPSGNDVDQFYNDAKEVRNLMLWIIC